MPQPWPLSMDWFDLTLATPAENLALDEALLHHVDQNPSRGIIRTWQPREHFVVVGRSNSVANEVHTDRCREEQIPIFRRSSGGGAVVIGPGCLAYALALPLTDDLRTGGVSTVTRAVMDTIASGLSALVPGIRVCGISDLAIGDRKFSGNSQRWLRNAFLHHGTILYDFDLPLIQRLLKPPSRQPDYRTSRSHDDFVVNVNASRETLIASLVSAWNGQPTNCPTEILDQVQSLVHTRYLREDWNQAVGHT